MVVLLASEEETAVLGRGLSQILSVRLVFVELIRSLIVSAMLASMAGVTLVLSAEGLEVLDTDETGLVVLVWPVIRWVLNCSLLDWVLVAVRVHAVVQHRVLGGVQLLEVQSTRFGLYQQGLLDVLLEVANLVLEFNLRVLLDMEQAHPSDVACPLSYGLLG